MDADSDVALDILITNVVCVFRTRGHLNLRKIALEEANVIYKHHVGKVLMNLENLELQQQFGPQEKLFTLEQQVKKALNLPDVYPVVCRH